jgi:Domain of unknown function (DUF5666)
MKELNMLALRMRFSSLGQPAVAGLVAAMLAAGAFLAGCGGGVGTGGTGVGSYTVGAITGFGSIIVNDVRYDDTAANVLDSDDGSRSSSELKLGMTVEVEGDTIGTDSSGSRAAKATRIRFGSELLGAVQSVDAAAGRLTVLGQTVVVAADTVLDEGLSLGLASLTVGSLVEVYAQIDASTGQYVATRIERASSAPFYKLRGLVSAVDSAARTLRIGQTTVLWSAVGSVPGDLAVGQLVRLQLVPAPDANGRWVAQAFGTALRAPPDQPETEFKGLITAFASAQSFSVNGLPVNASSASFPDGVSGLRLGARVEISGRSVAGVLIADKVSIESESKIKERGFEFKGPITALDTTAQTITVRNQVISTARSDLRFDNGVRSDLKLNRDVEVKAQLATSGTRLEATRIVFR